MDSDRGADFPPLAIRAQLRWDLVRRIIEAISPTTTIEVGSGQGAMGARIASMTTRSYIGLELDEHSYLQAKHRIEPFGGKVYNERLGTVEPEPARLLCAFEVLEHIEDDVAELEQWVRYIVPGGHLLLSVPAHQHRYGPMDAHVGHFRRYSPAGLTHLVESVGMVDVSSRLYGAPLGYGLEAVRNRIDANKLSDSVTTNASFEALTAASGRTFQFEHRSWKSAMATAGTIPFKYLQRVWPGGIGIVLLARKPLD